MIGLISIIIFILSLAGMAVILLRKMPAIRKVPERDFAFGNSLANGVKRGLKKMPVIKGFSYELYLQKVLSRIRVLTMKTENKTGHWLERLRQKNNKKHHISNDSYWDALKKAKDGK